MRSVFLLFLAVSLTVRGLASQTAAPGKSWPVATPASQGVNVRILDSLDREIARGDYGYVDRMLVIRNGKIVYDRNYTHDYDTIYADSARIPNPLNAGDPTGPYNYFNPWWHPTWRRGDLHSLQSVSKTVTSVIFGAAINRGDFPGVDVPALRFFDTTKVANIDDRKRRMLVRHLLTMTGGIDWDEDAPYIDGRNTAAAMEASHDWVGYTINRPMMREPGTKFNYSSGETEVLAEIFKKGTGHDIEEYAAKYLFGPIGIERWYWKRTPTGLVDTEGGLYLEAKDLARIWYLFLQDGVWNGKRIVSSDWIKQSTTPAIRTADRPGAPWYGFKWWLRLNPADTTKLVWSGSGFGGQSPMAFPERNLIVVFNAWNILPGGKGLPLQRVVGRILAGVPESKKARP